MDINKFAKFYEILSLPFQDIQKTKTSRMDTQTNGDGWMDGQRDNSIPPPTNTVCGGGGGYKYHHNQIWHKSLTSSSNADLKYHQPHN